MFSVLITVFIVSLAALMAWSVERDVAGSTIKTIPDAFWWAITTITSVGYGDKIPVSPEGKAVAVVLMFMGVALFGAIAATLATVFSPWGTAGLGYHAATTSSVTQIGQRGLPGNQLTVLSRVVEDDSESALSEVARERSAEFLGHPHRGRKVGRKHHGCRPMRLSLIHDLVTEGLPVI